MYVREKSTGLMLRLIRDLGYAVEVVSTNGKMVTMNKYDVEIIN